jgi:hypothetical protein
MIMLAVISAPVGAVLGLRYKVLVLVPSPGVIAVALAGVAHGDGAWSILLSSVAMATVVQLGYLLGVFTRFAAPCVPSLHSCGG